MNDQASALRLGTRDHLRLVPGGPDTDRPALVVGSGKGGVGKSMLASMVAVALAKSGRRVLLVDGAQNLGNLHVLLGVRPAITPQALLEHDAEPDELVIPIRDNLSLLPRSYSAPASRCLRAARPGPFHLSTFESEIDTKPLKAPILPVSTRTKPR